MSLVQGLPSLQLSAVPAAHVPAWHVSAPLHTLPSLHEIPFATAACWQPCTGSHVSVVQGLLSLQLGSVPAVQRPGRHVSAPLHSFPSLHGVPFGTAGCWQPVTGSQMSVVHGFPSSQLRDDPAVQVPDRHVSAPLHTLPSLHEVPFASAVCRHPPSGSQVSVVQGLLSLQLRGVPARKI